MATEDHKSKQVQFSGYAKYSSGRTSEGIERQMQNCASYARSLAGDTVPLFSDSSANAADYERPGLSELLEECERGEVDTVLVEDLDRISR